MNRGRSLLVAGRILGAALALVGRMDAQAPARVTLSWAWGTAAEWQVRSNDSIALSPMGDTGRRWAVVAREFKLTPEGCDRDTWRAPCTIRVTDLAGDTRLQVGSSGARIGSARIPSGGGVRLSATSVGGWEAPDSQPPGNLDPHWVTEELSGLIPLRWPDHSLAIGDTWPVEWATVRLGRAWEIDTLQAVATLDSIVVGAKRRSAWISVRGRGPGWIDFHGPQMTFDVGVAATIEWDIEGGHPVAAWTCRTGTATRVATDGSRQQFQVDESTSTTIIPAPPPAGTTP